MNTEEIVKLFNARKEYMRKYAKDRYHNDPVYREKQLKRVKNVDPKEYYQKNKERIKKKRIYNSYDKQGKNVEWKDKYPDDYHLLVSEGYILEDISKHPKTLRTKVIL